MPSAQTMYTAVPAHADSYTHQYDQVHLTGQAPIALHGYSISRAPHAHRTACDQVTVQVTEQRLQKLLAALAEVPVVAATPAMTAMCTYDERDRCL